MSTGVARPFELMQRQDEIRRIQLWEEVNGVLKEANLTGYTGKYAAFHSLTDAATAALIKIDITIEGDPELGIINIDFVNVAGPAGTDQDAFSGFEELTLFNPVGKRIPVSLPDWGGKLYGKFSLLQTRIV